MRSRMKGESTGHRSVLEVENWKNLEEFSLESLCASTCMWWCVWWHHRG